MSTTRAANYADPAWCEREYNPRFLVPDAANHYGRWPVWANETRARLPHMADVRYGPDPREVMDVFRAPSARGALVFIHGGYWRAFSKNESSWVADALVPAGYTVAVLNYPLCPQVTIADIATSCRHAIVRLWPLLGERERAGLVVSGHSAGGYLTAAMLVADWTMYGLPATPFTGALSISGVFELEPLINTTMNVDIKLTPTTARDWSLHVASPAVTAPLILAVGELESREFHRQSAQQAASWSQCASPPIAVPTRHHFDVVEELRRAGTPVFDLTTALLDRPAMPDVSA